MRRYAESTTVPVEKSKAEIERTLSRHGAEQFVSGWDSTGRAMIGFSIQSRMVQMRLLLPAKDDPKFRKTATGRVRRDPGAAEREWEQACRVQWRALALVVKAKLEAVEAGISTIEREFLADILLTNGQTFGVWAAPQLEAVYSKGVMPQLLPKT